MDDDKVPQDVRDTWWCGLHQVSVEPPTDFAKPITYVLPKRRPVRTGLTVRTFTSSDAKDWHEVTGGATTPASFKQKAFGFGITPGCSTLPFGLTGCNAVPCGGFGAFGINQNDQTQGSMTGTALTPQFEQSFRPEQIKDGTSNTIAILIGLH